ncbi:MAG TPA: O-antigen ligase family protein [Verrucomicrobiae bacterium]|jgi:hypothetical protein
MFKIHRLLVAYAVAIPLALILGYLVATPDMASVAVLGMVFLVLVIPLLLQWSHPLLIFCWNSAFVFGFVPGDIQMWIVFAGLTFAIGLVHRFMGHKSFLRAPELVKPILFLAAVVLGTARIRGGLGVHAFGNSNYGGRNYFMIIAAVMGYFGLISQQISTAKSARAVKWFFLAGMTNAVSTILYAIGPIAYFLFWIIPASNLSGQIVYSWTETNITRIEGFGTTGAFLMCFALARWGIGSLFQWDKPWRMGLIALSALLTLFSGFRSDLVFLVLLFAFQFLIEGWWRTALLPIMLVAGAVCLTPMLFFANKLPGAVQRSLAFLPVTLDPAVRAEAEASTRWRYDMWAEIWPEIPKYLLVGKGYAVDPDELYLTVTATQQGRLSGYEGSMLAGDYHNGPLSILIPFGIFGLAGFLWLLAAGAKVLYWNFRFGDPRLKKMNTTLLVYFLAQSVFFIVIFGAFNVQLSVFLGILGLSISLNGGVCRKPAAARQPAYSSPMAMPAPAA